jgi:hypothetical protein
MGGTETTLRHGADVLLCNVLRFRSSPTLPLALTAGLGPFTPPTSSPLPPPLPRLLREGRPHALDPVREAVRVNGPG